MAPGREDESEAESDEESGDHEESDEERDEEQSNDSGSSGAGRPGLYLSEEVKNAEKEGPLSERQLGGLLDQLAGNVSEEDTGSWDEEAGLGGEDVLSGAEEEYYEEDDYGYEGTEIAATHRSEDPAAETSE
jgi:hypothetical protein